MNKYYTQEIEDFHIGFEYEIEDEEDKWPKVKFDFEYGWKEFPEDYNQKTRVKYLDKEDIESLGYNQILDSECFIDSNRKLLLTFFEECNKITIFRKNGPIKVLFEGICKSKNDLKTIQKLLGI